MYERRVSTSESPRVEVTACQGDLVVTTWDNAEVLIEVDSEQVLTVEERDDAVALVANSDCNLVVPAGASLVVVQSQGDLSVRGVRGGVEVVTAQGEVVFNGGVGDATTTTVQGDLVVEDWSGPVKVRTVQGDAKVQKVTGPVDVDTVIGDLSVTEIGGSLSAQSVGGDAYLRALNGPFSVGDVRGDLTGRLWTSDADVAQVGGDVSLKTVFAGPFTYRIQARGDIVVKALPDSNATFTLQAAQGRVRAKGLTGETTETEQWQGTIGDGQAQVILASTHGSVTLKTAAEEDRAAFTFMADLDEIGAEGGVAAQELAWRIQQRVADKLSKIDFEAIAQREAERARRQAEREMAKAQQAAEKARRRAERAQRKAREKTLRWHFEWDSERHARRAPRRSQGVSEEERLAVLRMLAEGKISSQEAETLLQALES